jgi:hypothetical protein
MVDLPRFPRDRRLITRVAYAGKARAAPRGTPLCTLGAIATCPRHTGVFIVAGAMGAWRGRTS